MPAARPSPQDPSQADACLLTAASLLKQLRLVLLGGRQESVTLVDSFAVGDDYILRRDELSHVPPLGANLVFLELDLGP